MKRFVVVFSGIAVLTLMAGCCTKKGCLSGESTRVDAYGYTPEELAHVTLTTYQKGSGYTVPLDSTAALAQNPEDDHYILAALILAENDYKIKLQDTGDEFWVSDIATEADKCDINGPLCDYDIEKIVSYRLNGTLTQYNGVAIQITKP